VEKQAQRMTLTSAVVSGTQGCLAHHRCVAHLQQHNTALNKQLSKPRCMVLPPAERNSTYDRRPIICLFRTCHV